MIIYYKVDLMTSQIDRFKIIHNQSKQIIETSRQDIELIQQKITKYVSIMVQHHSDYEEQSELMFDYFCQNNGVQILSNLIKIDSLLAIKCYSLLLINLKHQIWMSYILCQPFLVEAIEAKCNSDEQQWTQYYISFIKSLSIRLSQDQITIFYNKKHFKFPLVYQAMKYFNHPDFMVRTSVMNIILQLLKIKQKRTVKYFSRFPFTSYLVTFCCEVHHLINNYHVFFKQNKINQLNCKRIQNYKTDLTDYLYYFNDLFNFGTQKSNEILEQAFITYLLFPVLSFILDDVVQVKKHGLLILLEYIKIIKNKNIGQLILRIIFNKNINKQFVTYLNKQIYYPQVYKQPYVINNYYWDRHNMEINKQCLQVFDDLQSYPIQQIDLSMPNSMQFQQQLQRISQFIGYSFLKNIKINNIQAIFQKTQQDMIENPIKKQIQTILVNNKNQIFILAINILISCHKNKNVNQQLKLQLQVPRFNTSQLQNLNQSESFIKKCVFTKIIQANLYQDNILQLLFCVHIAKSFLYQPESFQIQQKLLLKQRQISTTLLQQINQNNIIIIVQNFTNKSSQIVLQYQPLFQFKYSYFLLSTQQCLKKIQQFIIPKNQIQKFQHLIYLFWIFRIFITHYFQYLYESTYYNYKKSYQSKFNSLYQNWKKGDKVKLKFQKLYTCQIQTKKDKKRRKGLIVQDSSNLIILQGQNEFLYKVFINTNWKQVNLQMSKQDIANIQVVIKNQQQLILIFDDQIRSNNVLQILNEIKQKRYQQQLSFIFKFIKNSLQQ